MPPSQADSSSSTELAVPGFRFERLIGRGPITVVFEATQLNLDRRVAVKVFPKGPGFEQRVRQLRWPEHPNVVSLYAAGPCAQGYFVAMQLIRGASLADRQLSRAGMLQVLSDVGAALDAAHRAGIAHGTLTAGSVLVDRDGHGFLSDFGLGPVDATPASDRADFAALVRERLGWEPPALEESAAAIMRSAEGALPRRRRWRWGLAAAAVAVAGAGVLVAGSSSGPAEAPPVLPGAAAIGSTLPTKGIQSVDCSGRPPSGASEPCAVVQTRLKGRPVTPGSGGVVRRWEVRGARGELALQVLRRHGNRFFMVARTPYLLVRDEALHVLPANLPVRAGDLVGLAVAPGAAIGVRDGSRGAATARRFGPADVYAERFDQGADSGQELLLRVEYVPGARWRPRGRLTGKAAALAPPGRELDALHLDRDVSLAAVSVGGRIVVDLFVAERRLARLPVADADPAGQLGALSTQRVRLGQEIVRLTWRNPHGLVSHDYAADARSLMPLD
jgi:hypothetical protein